MEKFLERLRTLWSKPVFRIGGGLVLVLIIVAAGGGLYLSQRAPAQPIDFPHNVHVGLGAECQFCHVGVTWSDTAGLPETDKCWSCHVQIDKQSAELDKLAEFAASGEQIPWTPVFIQPDFVHFPHQNHVAAGLSCETCHGDIGNQRVAEPIARQNMGWCLDCHQKMQPEDFKHLSDCSTCHY